MTGGSDDGAVLGGDSGVTDSPAFISLRGTVRSSNRLQASGLMMMPKQPGTAIYSRRGHLCAIKADSSVLLSSCNSGTAGRVRDAWIMCSA